MTDKFKIEIAAADAPRITDWIATRGGVAIWQSLDLAEAGQRTFTPALTADGKPTTAPNWRYNTKPVEIVTQPNDIGVYSEILFKAFPVSLRRSNNGLTLKLTDGSQHKLDKTMADCRKKHGNAHYRKGILEDSPASIGVYYATESIPLT